VIGKGFRVIPEGRRRGTGPRIGGTVKVPARFRPGPVEGMDSYSIDAAARAIANEIASAAPLA